MAFEDLFVATLHDLGFQPSCAEGFLTSFFRHCAELLITDVKIDTVIPLHRFDRTDRLALKPLLMYENFRNLPSPHVG